MKRSEMNAVYTESSEAFARHGWALPPNPKWDITDFGLGDFSRFGLTLINLAEEVEYCEKLMYVRKEQVTPNHYHKKKKEDIISRFGDLVVRLHTDGEPITVQINGEMKDLDADPEVTLSSGERITLVQGVKHSFWASSDYAVIGEVSTANDDVSDNYFADENIGRYSEIDEDEPALIKLLSD